VILQLTEGVGTSACSAEGPSRPSSLMFTLYVFLIADAFSVARPVGLHL
jgi:hypothetical protein